MIILFSNRNKKNKKDTIRSFDNRLSTQLSLSKVVKEGGKWHFQNFDNTNHVDTVKALHADVDNGKPWVFFVHGFNFTMQGNLSQIEKIISTHNVNVMAFSWPSATFFKFGKVINTALFAKRYRMSQNKARLSAPFLKEALAVVNEAILSKNIPISFMVHSLGNYVLQKMVEVENGHVLLSNFSNIILSQADVDYDGHKKWVEKINSRGKCYCVTNWQDIVLSLSNTINKPRLGHTISHTPSESITYVDYTDAIGVGNEKTHGAFKISQTDNKYIYQFINDALTGRPVISFDGFKYDNENNSYEITGQYGNEYGPAKRVIGGDARRRLRLNDHRRLNRIGSNRYL